jgi:MEMO1 family protein
MIRPPAVAGRFYPSDPKELAAQVDRFSAGIRAASTKLDARACMVPHAGYMYSGQVAGAVYGSVEIPRKCILIGPRHFPRGEPLAILTEGAFQTPLGNLAIDEQLAREIAQACPRLREDAIAHQSEHSLEVQIPFLQRLAPDVQFVPIVLATDRYGVIEEIGHAIAKAIRASKEPVLLIASSDLNHYENEAVTREKDEMAIAQVLAVDPRGLYDTVRANGISMCGYAATVATLVAARDLGASEGNLVRHDTSASVTGDYEQVVGYAGVVIP